GNIVETVAVDQGGGDIDSGSQIVLKPVKITQPRESLSLELTAAAYAVVDRNTGEVLLSKDIDEQRSIASLTKLMTAIVFVENNPGWDTQVTIENAHRTDGSDMKVSVGDTFTTQQLFYVMLSASKNDAANALVSSTGISRQRFVELMNEKANALGLSSTHFVDPTGLHSGNVSSGRDIAILIAHALEIPEIQKATTTRFYTVFSQTQQQDIVSVNTNLVLLDSYLNTPGGYRMTASKTGYIAESGYCLVSSVIDPSGNEVIAVVLGADSRDARHHEVKALATWAFDNFIWKP
ncbi:MAG TPA: D-alanyl-D-alanine carboxypeptidase family protein, partial [Patescibacteria group bacterium]|nr:D-alanyl-D-alanine carboxypeptidase family protein [Patescibacteria group bacterium]